LRIFPVSLNDLCKTFNVDGKSCDYNPMFNSIELFKDLDLLKSFIKYSLQDSLCLLNALNKAQNIYYNDYKVDLGNALSTSNLSLKIFRSHFLKVNIPILKGWHDNFIRKGYFGGATDYYVGRAKYIFYYDKNSLYP
jgi:hypothetical protein